MIKAYSANYFYWDFDGHEEMNCTVSANSESEALGLVLDYYDTVNGRWWIKEINLDDVGVKEQAYRSSNG